MTKVVIYGNSSLDSFAERTQQYTHDKYHSHPSFRDEDGWFQRVSFSFQPTSAKGSDPDRGASWSGGSAKLNTGKTVF